MFKRIKEWLEVNRLIKIMKLIDKSDPTTKEMVLVKYTDDELRNELAMRQLGRYLGYFDEEKKIYENMMLINSD